MDPFNRAHLQNIKNIFEEKTDVNLDVKQPRRHSLRMAEVFTRRSVAAVLAVALTLCTAGAAYAVVTNLFSTYFTNRTGETLTPEQYQFIEEKSVGIGQSITADGYTVTVNSAIGDAQILYLAISVEGPEGTKLDLGSEEGNLFFGYMECNSLGSYSQKGHLVSHGNTWISLDDGDGRENTATVLMREQYVMSADSNRVYTDGEIWRLQLADLTVQAADPPYEETTLTKGGWSFEFPLTEMNGEVEMISSPLVCVAQAGGEMGPRESVDMMVDSLVLRPFSVTLRYSYIPGNRPEAIDILDVYLVMKDGSTVTARPRSGGGAGGVGSMDGTMSYLFDAPVMLDEVAYVVLPEDVQVPFPEK